MLNMVFPVKSCYVATPQTISTAVAEQVLPLEIAVLTKRLVINGEELCRARRFAVGTREAIYMICRTKGAHEVPTNITPTFLASPARTYGMS